MDAVGWLLVSVWSMGVRNALREDEQLVKRGVPGYRVMGVSTAYDQLVKRCKNSH